MTNTLGEAGIAFMESRGISAEIATRLEIYTPNRGPNKAPVIAFPYLEKGRVVAEKFRTLDKRFWQRPGGKKTFYNADILDDPAFENSSQSLLITEGEIDCLTAIECGFPFTVSVPDGAPPPSEKTQPVDPASDAFGKFEYVFNNRERLKKIQRFILAVDADAAGQRLAEELVRRLLASRCLFVTYPQDCKDLNDVLIKHGPTAVAAVINGAKPYPVRGLYQLSDYPEVGPLQTYVTGWPTLDPHLKMFRGEFMVITGIPSHGKSTWTLNLLANMTQHGWRAALFSPEMPPLPYMRAKLRRIHGANADRWIGEHFFFIDADPIADDDTVFDLDWIIDRATDAIFKYGIDVLVIDPWNEIEHARLQYETASDYVGRSIRALKRFGRMRNVSVIVVAHPTKDVSGRDGVRTPTLYDISDSAQWYNKADHGLIIERDSDTDITTVHVAKSRFEDAGERGSVKMRFDRVTSRYQAINEELI